MTRVGIISQARMTSTRLPGKVLLNVGGRSYLAHHLSRLGEAGYPIIVATTTNSADQPIIEECQRLGIPAFRGSEHDVLARYADVIRAFNLDVAVRVTSDCPLIDAAVVKSGIDAYLDADRSDMYLSNTLVRTYPRGFDFEVFSGDALLAADVLATSPEHREHVTPWLYAEFSKMIKVNLPWREDKSHYRLTLDTIEDHDLLRTLIQKHDAASLTCASIIDLMDDHPHLAGMNSSVQQKSGAARREDV